MKLKKGDKVKVMAGKDRGKEGSVEKVWLKGEKVTIPGINMFKKHSKPKTEGQKGGIIDFVRPLSSSKVALICPKCKQVTRVGYKLTEKSAQSARGGSGGEKVRICRKCDQEI